MVSCSTTEGCKYVYREEIWILYLERILRSVVRASCNRLNISREFPCVLCMAMASLKSFVNVDLTFSIRGRKTLRNGCVAGIFVTKNVNSPYCETSLFNRSVEYSESSRIAAASSSRPRSNPLSRDCSDEWIANNRRAKSWHVSLLTKADELQRPHVSVISPSSTHQTPESSLQPAS